jgi:hypothetical protein
MLTPQDIKANDRVWVFRGGRIPEPGTVDKVGRAWVTVSTEFQRGVAHRFRLDDQTDRLGNGVGYVFWFKTEAQFTRERDLQRARETLFAHHLDCSYRSKRADDDLLIALAAFLAVWDVEHPEVSLEHAGGER